MIPLMGNQACCITGMRTHAGGIHLQREEPDSGGRGPGAAAVGPGVRACAPHAPGPLPEGVRPRCSSRTSLQLHPAQNGCVSFILPRLTLCSRTSASPRPISSHAEGRGVFVFPLPQEACSWDGCKPVSAT